MCLHSRADNSAITFLAIRHDQYVTQFVCLTAGRKKKKKTTLLLQPGGNFLMTLTVETGLPRLTGLTDCYTVFSLLVV